MCQRGRCRLWETERKMEGRSAPTAWKRRARACAPGVPPDEEDGGEDRDDVAECAPGTGGDRPLEGCSVVCTRLEAEAADGMAAVRKGEGLRKRDSERRGE